MIDYEKGSTVPTRCKNVWGGIFVFVPDYPVVTQVAMSSYYSIVTD